MSRLAKHIGQNASRLGKRALTRTCNVVYVHVDDVHRIRTISSTAWACTTKNVFRFCVRLNYPTVRGRFRIFLHARTGCLIFVFERVPLLLSGYFRGIRSRVGETVVKNTLTTCKSCFTIFKLFIAFTSFFFFYYNVSITISVEIVYEKNPPFRFYRLKYFTGLTMVKEKQNVPFTYFTYT